MFEKYRVKNFEEGIEPHEVFLDKLAKVKEEEWGITQKKIEVPVREKLAYLILAIFAGISVFLFARVFYLQISRGEYFAGLSEDNRIRNQYISAERGVIYDSNFKQMVFNVPSFDLLCDKRDLLALSEDSSKEISEIAEIIGKDSAEIKNQIERSKNSQVLIYENMPQEILVAMEARINDFPEFSIVKSTVRNYPSESFFSHLLGHMGKISPDELKSYQNYSINDYIGKTGAEKSYENILRGQPGVIEVEKDSLGKKKGEQQISTPQDGQSVVLNLDSELQKKLTDILEQRLKDMNLRRAAAVALNPQNGAVLAMVSLPSFDNNIFSQGMSANELQKIQNDSAKPFFNRVISGQYPIGSSIKPFLAAGALQEDVISPTKNIYDKGYIEVRNQYDPNIVYKYGGLEKEGYYDMRKAISESANIYFYTIGGGYGSQEGLGPQRIKKYLELFGFGSKTNIDLPAEADGFVPSPEWKKSAKGESWWDGDTYHFSIGQGDLTATPLQVAAAYAAIANGGTLYQPQILKEIVDGKKVVEKNEPVVLRQNFIDPENLKVVREGMKMGATTGTGRVLSSLPVQAASKTGTAQTSRDEVYEIWASVFAPYDNPEIVLVVLVENVEGLHVPALMVARDALQWYFTR